MKEFSCPTCGTHCCPTCNGRRCDCEPGNMEIAIYCNCPPTNILDFMRKQLDLPPHERKRKHLESKKNLKKWLKNLGNIPLEVFKIPEEEEEEDLLEAALREHGKDEEE